MQIYWINFLLHLFSTFSTNILTVISPFHSFSVEKVVERVEISMNFLINKLLKIIFTKFCFPLDKKIPFN